MRTKLLAKGIDSNLAVSKGNVKKPVLNRPSADSRDSHHAKFLKRTENPRCPKLGANRDKPRHAKLRINGKDPKLVLPITDNVLTDSTPDSPNKNSINSRQAGP